MCINYNKLLNMYLNYIASISKNLRKNMSLRNAMIISHLVILIVFMGIYYFIYTLDNTTFDRLANRDKPMTLTDMMYFTCGIHTTLGLGDIYPSKKIAEITVSLHVMLVFFVSLFGINSAVF